MNIPGIIPSILMVALIAAIQAALGQLTNVREAWAYLVVILLDAALKWIQINRPASISALAPNGTPSKWRRWLVG